MKSAKLVTSLTVFALLVGVLLVPAFQGQFSNLDRFRHLGFLRGEDEDRSNDQQNRIHATEAPTGFDNLPNGFDKQGPDFETLDEDNVKALASFNDNRFI